MLFRPHQHILALKVQSSKLRGHNQIKAVGEETLAAEIQNWVQRAAAKNEPLEITLGKLDGMKLVKFSQAAWPL